MRRGSIVVALGVVLCWVLPAGVGRAQSLDAGVGEGGVGDGGAEADAQAPSGLQPPELVQFVDAEYPDEAEEAGIEGAVVLELTVADDGTVTAAEVLESPGHGLGPAARDAARQFRFEPARKDGTPVPAVIRYRYVFELDTRPKDAATSAADAGARGPDAGTPGRSTEKPPSDAGVAARDAGTADGAAPRRPDAATMDGDAGTGPSDRAAQDGPGAVFGAVAEVDKPRRSAVRRTLEQEELTNIPGTRGDALRAVELLPGVGRAPFGAGQLVIRGSGPDSSQVFFEGVPVPLLYHFGGITSFINSRLLDRIEFYPGNFSVRYGRKTGGVVEVEARRPATDGLHGVAKLGVIDASILAEGPIGDNASIAIALRRSYIDAVFGAVAPDDVGVVAAPVYWDYQAMASWRPTSRDEIRFMVYGSSDRFEVLLDEPADTDPALRGNVELSTQFHYFQTSWDRQLSPTVEQEIELEIGPQLLDFGAGPAVDFDSDSLQIYGRAEWRADLAPTVRLVGGLDIAAAPFSIDFRGPAPRQREGAEMQPISTQEQVSVDAKGVNIQPAAYLESHLEPWSWLRLVLGVRLDYFDLIREFAFDPRAVAIWSVTDDTRIKTGAGIFSQPPDPARSNEQIGNPNLEPIRAYHLNLGFEHDILDGVSIGAEGFFKRLWDRVVETEGGVPPGFINEGVGRIYGLEVSARVSPEGRPFFGRLAYTLSRSERRDHPGQRWRLFDFDQTHILNLAGVYRFNHGWEVGATVRVISGNPRTPVATSIYDANQDLYIPVYGRTNSARNPLFNRLDIRVQKKWDFDTWSLALYLDVQNVYNATNPQGRTYNFDYTESASVRGLPIIPALGLRGEL